MLKVAQDWAEHLKKLRFQAKISQEDLSARKVTYDGVAYTLSFDRNDGHNSGADVYILSRATIQRMENGELSALTLYNITTFHLLLGFSSDQIEQILTPKGVMT
jgi:transcriptional regulator with XRE-family HTH domain